MKGRARRATLLGLETGAGRFWRKQQGKRPFEDSVRCKVGAPTRDIGRSRLFGKEQQGKGAFKENT